jgi:hypothetical protein
LPKALDNRNKSGSDLLPRPNLLDPSIKYRSALTRRNIIDIPRLSVEEVRHDDLIPAVLNEMIGTLKRVIVQAENVCHFISPNKCA